MKITLLFALLSTLAACGTDGATLSAPAAAVMRTVDLVPRSVSYVNLPQRNVQKITIKAQNIGNSPTSGHRGLVLFNGNDSLALITAPSPVVQPGQLAVIEFEVPANTVRHCQKVQGNIDLKRTFQDGPQSVFANDSIAHLFVQRADALTVCLDPIVRR